MEARRERPTLQARGSGCLALTRSYATSRRCVLHWYSRVRVAAARLTQPLCLKFAQDESSSFKSPRMECQAASYEQGLPPEPLIIRRKATRSVDLSHFGMGDRRTLVLSRGLQVLPDVDTVSAVHGKLRPPPTHTYTYTLN